MNCQNHLRAVSECICVLHLAYLLRFSEPQSDSEQGLSKCGLQTLLNLQDPLRVP